MPTTRAIVGSAILFICLTSGVNVNAWLAGRPGFRGEGWGYGARLAAAEGALVGASPVIAPPVVAGPIYRPWRRVEAEIDDAVDADAVDENSAELDDASDQPISISAAPTTPTTTETTPPETDDLVHPKKKIPENPIAALTLHEKAVEHLEKKIAANPTDDSLKTKLALIKASAVKFENRVKEMITNLAKRVTSLSPTDSDSTEPTHSTSHALHTVNKAIKCLQHMDEHGEGDKTELHETIQKAEDTKTALENHLAEHGDVAVHPHIASLINGNTPQVSAEIDAALDSSSVTPSSTSSKPHTGTHFRIHITPEERLAKLQERLTKQEAKLDTEKADPTKSAVIEANIEKCKKRIAALEDHIAKRKAKQVTPTTPTTPTTPSTPTTPTTTTSSKTSEAEIDAAGDADALLEEDAGGDGMGPGAIPGVSGHARIPLWSRPAAQRLQILEKRIAKLSALQASGAPEAPGAAPGTRARRIANTQKAIARTQHLLSIGQTGPLPAPAPHGPRQQFGGAGPTVVSMQPGAIPTMAEAEIDDAVDADPTVPATPVTPVHEHVKHATPDEIASWPAEQRLAYWESICDSAMNMRVKARCQQRIIHTQQLIKDGKTGPIKPKPITTPSTPANAMDALDVDNEVELDEAPEAKLIYDPQSNELHHDHEGNQHEPSMSPMPELAPLQPQLPHFTEEQLNSVLPAHVHVSVEVDMEQEKPKHHHALKKIKEIMGNQY